MRIIRYRIPVDDQVHQIQVPEGDHPFLHFAAREEDSVDLWVLDDDELPTRPARLRVVGTGDQIELEQEWIGTCVSPSQTFVWHVVGSY